MRWRKRFCYESTLSQLWWSVNTWNVRQKRYRLRYILVVVVVVGHGFDAMARRCKHITRRDQQYDDNCIELKCWRVECILLKLSRCCYMLLFKWTTTFVYIQRFRREKKFKFKPLRFFCCIYLGEWLYTLSLSTQWLHCDYIQIYLYI